MSKYFNPRLLNAVIAGTGMRNPVRPHVILGSEDGEFVRGDLMDANAIQEFINQKISDLVNNAPEALDTLKELADAIQENGVADLVTKGQLEAALNTKADEEDLLDYVKKSDMSTMDANGHEYVEIGGIKWATMNIGATSITDKGLYFQWGDVQGYTAGQVGNGTGQKAFKWEDYKYGNGTSNPNGADMTKYNNTDGKIVLELSDDSARANWGGTWRMPTKEEFQTLRNAVNTAWTGNYQGSGVAGLICTDKQDSSKVLFFPVSGSNYNTINHNDDECYYWSSSRHDTYPVNAYHLDFYSSGTMWNSFNSRFYGYVVRGILDGGDKYATKAEVEQLQSNIVQSDWGQSDSTAIDYIKNKPEVALKSDLYTTAIDANGHDYVDLGLPSGTLWATMNVGANLTTDYGNYYMYGKGTAQYNSSDPLYSGTENPLSSSVDTARQAWGGTWHMPTRAQMQELINNTTYEWTTINSVNGGKFTATNGNSIFIPAAGRWYNGSQASVDSKGYYWSSTPYNSDSAYYLDFDNSSENVYYYGYKRGCSIRPVIEPSPVYIFATSSNLQSLEARVEALEAYHTT